MKLPPPPRPRISGTLQFDCPACGARATVSAEQLGFSCRCWNCNETFGLPKLSADEIKKFRIQVPSSKDDCRQLWGVLTGVGIAFALVVGLIVSSKNEEARKQHFVDREREREAGQRQLEREDELRRHPPKLLELPPRERVVQHADYSRRSSSTTFNMSSDGNTWNAASDGEKRQLARALSKNSPHGNSPELFYNAMNTFYRNGDSYIKETSLDDLTKMTEAASVIPIEELNSLPDSVIRRAREKRLRER